MNRDNKLESTNVTSESKTVYLSKKAQQIMDRALRKSVKIVEAKKDKSDE